MPVFKEELFEFTGILEEDCDRNLELLVTKTQLNFRDDSSVQREILDEEDSQYLARQYVRSLFSFLEAFIHALKQTALEGCDKNQISYSEFEKDIVLNQKREINSNGVESIKEHYLKTDYNVKFAFKFFSKAYSITNPLETTEKRDGVEKLVPSQLWGDYKVLKNLRNRITHPRNLSEVNVKYRDLVETVRFHQNFKEELMLIMIELEIARPLRNSSTLSKLNEQISEFKQN